MPCLAMPDVAMPDVAMHYFAAMPFLDHPLRSLRHPYLHFLSTLLFVGALLSRCSPTPDPYQVLTYS